MKTIFVKMLTVVSVVCLLLTGCGSPASTSSEKKTINIEIVKQLDHASLDEIANAITAELDAIAKKEGVTIHYTVDSGQNDGTVLKQIGDMAISNQVDAIIPIATLAAQTMTVCAEETKTPVIYAAITDPESAGLTGIDYVTGTSDALNTNVVCDMMTAINPDLSKVGLLYSLSEINSAKSIEEAKKYLDEHHIEYVEQTGNTNEEIITAASVLIQDGVQAIFTPTDNVVMASEKAIAPMFVEAGIPHYTGADSFVRSGAFATCGVNYTDLGTQTADLAYQAITEGMDGLDDSYLVNGGIITVNTETAEALGLDPSILSQFGTLSLVATSED